MEDRRSIRGKRTKTHIPPEVTTVRNAATGETRRVQPPAIRLPIAESVAELEKRLADSEADNLILQAELAIAKKRISELNAKLIEGCK